VKLNAGGRWATYDSDSIYEISVGGEAAIAENLTLSGAVGYVDDNSYPSNWTYAWAKLAWAPGGGFTASVKGSVTMEGDETGYGDGPGYKIETELKKTFE